MEYKIGQTFERYDDGAFQWCRVNGARLVFDDSAMLYRIEAGSMEPLEELRAQKLAELTAAHEDWRDNTAYFFSSLGFPADGKTATVTDLSLLFAMSQAVGAEYTASFMDYENTEHTLDAEGLRTLYAEEGLARNQGYYQKWALREAINAAQTAAELDAIAIDFTPADFSKSED